MLNALEGRVYRLGDEGYEQARRAVTWHAGTPNRFPAVIVQARNENNVAAAVRLARTEGRQIAVRSGGHSWAGSHLRDGILLLDVSQLRDISIHAEQMTATVQPGLRGAELNTALKAHNLFFPIGHCTGVGLGGYLLQGGFGWSGRPFGPACMSVTGIDVVTADGERLYADEMQNADLFWAARGSGPGFFAVVTRFHLKLYPRHRVTMNSGYTYPIEAFEEVYRWVHEIGCETPTEINVILTRNESVRKEGPVIVLNATAFADSEQEARSALSLYERCPARHRALAAQVNEVTTIAELSRSGLDPHFDPTRRYVADNMWTHSPFDDLLPGLRAIIETLPPAPSHMLLMNWGYTHAPQRPPMAYSVEDNFYYALYVAWNDPADDDTYKHWVTERMRAMEPFATGIQLADENLINRPARFVTDDHLRRLDQLRATYDPDGLFVSWLGRPPLAHV
jgi:FAD/FMN-containing dehydrogenase